jgi:2-keto-3-deoxy-L-rhamnonate aldolase RhmA
MITNAMRSRMADGGLALGLGLRQARTVDIGRAMATMGIDWAFIDLEHNSMSIDAAVQIAVASQDAGVAPIVRVPAGDLRLACRVLDGGAMGIVLPHVNSGAEAAAFADACRYPPAGHRSIAGGLPQIGFRAVAVAEAVASIDSSILLLPMVETAEATQHIEAIAATPGIDGILVGCQDLCLELGIPGDVGHERARKVVLECIEACRRHGKWAGLGGVGDPALIAEYAQAGLHFALIGNDLGFLISAVATRVGALRAQAKAAP